MQFKKNWKHLSCASKIASAWERICSNGLSDMMHILSTPRLKKWRSFFICFIHMRFKPCIRQNPFVNGDIFHLFFCCFFFAIRTVCYFALSFGEELTVYLLHLHYAVVFLPSRIAFEKLTLWHLIKFFNIV